MSAPASAALPPQPSAVEGMVEGIHDGRLTGWAWAPQAPHIPLTVELRDGGLLLGSRPASDFRADLKAAGKRDGACGFSFDLPSGILDGRLHCLAVSIAGEKTRLANDEIHFGPLHASAIFSELVGLRQKVAELSRIVQENFTATAALPDDLVRTLSDRIAAQAEIQRETIARELDALRKLAFAPPPLPAMPEPAPERPRRRG